MAGRLEGKVALVTGASRGIGRAIAQRLAADGAVVAVHYGQSQAAAEETLAAIMAAGGDGFLVQGDVAATAGVANIFAELDVAMAGRGLGQMHILVNNAGVGVFTDIEHMTEADFDRAFNTNVKGPMFIAQAALKRMADGGRIINISSMVGHNAYPAIIPYSASKAALDQMTLCLAAGLGGRKITVNAVAPGATMTDFAGEMNEQTIAYLEATTALGAIGQAPDIAKVVAFLASDEGSWITGERIRASGGMHL